jgi:hypothetical protein
MDNPAVCSGIDESVIVLSELQSFGQNGIRISSLEELNPPATVFLPMQDDTLIPVIGEQHIDTEAAVVNLFQPLVHRKCLTQPTKQFKHKKPRKKSFFIALLSAGQSPKTLRSQQKVQKPKRNSHHEIALG